MIAPDCGSSKSSSNKQGSWPNFCNFRTTLRLFVSCLFVVWRHHFWFDVAAIFVTSELGLFAFDFVVCQHVPNLVAFPSNREIQELHVCSYLRQQQTTVPCEIAIWRVYMYAKYTYQLYIPPVENINLIFQVLIRMKTQKNSEKSASRTLCWEILHNSCAFIQCTRRSDAEIWPSHGMTWPWRLTFTRRCCSRVDCFIDRPISSPVNSNETLLRHVCPRFLTVERPWISHKEKCQSNLFYRVFF